MWSVIVYHAGCPDGVTAFVIAQSACNGSRGYPLSNGQEIHDLEGETILFVDIAVSRANLMELNDKNKRVRVLDHHKSNERELSSIPQKPAVPGAFMPRMPEVVFDMNRSGAMLAWDEFYSSTPAPLFVRYIQDHDLWKFALPRSREVRAAFNTLDFRNVEGVTKLIGTFTERMESIADTGEQIMQYNENFLFPQMSSNAFSAMMGPHKIIVCACSVPALMSEFGAWLVQKHDDHDFVLMWEEKTNTSGKIRVCSLRGSGKVDLSVVAQEHGGGGHPNAAGFRIPTQPFHFIINPI